MEEEGGRGTPVPGPRRPRRGMRAGDRLQNTVSTQESRRPDIWAASRLKDRDGEEAARSRLTGSRAYLIGLAQRLPAAGCDRRKAFITSRLSPRASAAGPAGPSARPVERKAVLFFICLHGSRPGKTARFVTCAPCIMLIRFEDSCIVFIRAITFALIKLRGKIRMHGNNIYY